MAEFSVWTDETAAGSIRVLHRNPGSRKHVTDYVVKKDERMTIDGKMRGAQYIANYYVDAVRARYRAGSLGVADPTASDEKLSDLAEAYLEDKENNSEKELSWKTLSHYRYSLEAVQQHNSISTLEQFMSLDFREWVKKMRVYRWKKGPKGKEHVGLSNHTIRGTLVDITVFCSWLIEKKKIQKSPIPEGVMPEMPKGRPRFYTDEEFAALEAVIEKLNHFAHVGIRLAHDYGLRRVEITGDGKERMEGVLWEDLIWRRDGKVDLNVRPEVTKGLKGGRKLRLSPGFLALLGPKKTGPLVPLKYDAFWSFFKKARRISKINAKLTVHGQRHTFAKDFLQKTGRSQAALRDLMGHKDVSTTQIYSHLEEGYLDESMEALHEARNNGSATVASR